MNILIVGANSIVSQQLIRLLNSDGDHLIYGLCNISTNNLKEEAEYIKFDDLDKLKIEFDLVFFIASFIPYGEWNEVSKKLIDTNIKLLLDISALYPESKMIYCSSVSVYGASQIKIDESTDVKPDNIYAISKLAGELIVKSHPKWCVLRISSIIGDGVKSPTFIPRAIQQAKEKNEILIFGDGSRKQNYIDIDDLTQMLFLTGTKDINGMFLAVASSSYSNLEIAEIICSEIPDTKIIFKGEDSSNSTIFDSRKSRSEMGISSEVDIRQSIVKMIHGK